MENECSLERGGRGVLVFLFDYSLSLALPCFTLFLYAFPSSVTLVYYLWDDLGRPTRSAPIPSILMIGALVFSPTPHLRLAPIAIPS